MTSVELMNLYDTLVVQANAERSAAGLPVLDEVSISSGKALIPTKDPSKDETLVILDTWISGLKDSAAPQTAAQLLKKRGEIVLAGEGKRLKDLEDNQFYGLLAGIGMAGGAVTSAIVVKDKSEDYLITLAGYALVGALITAGGGLVYKKISEL